MTQRMRLMRTLTPLGLALALAFTGLALTAHRVAAAPLACAYDGGTNTRTCELWAKTGTLTLPDASTVTIWGYADGALNAASLPGPEITANAGETLVIILHNDLAVTTTLAIPAFDAIPDLTGIAPGGSKSYTFANVQPGTHLYEAGLGPDAGIQAAMGLHGALLVNTATPNELYGPTTAYSSSVTLVLSEIDPALHADPLNFNLRHYAAKYWLINGKAYPDTSAVAVNAGDVIAVRYLNASFSNKWVGVLGVTQSIVAEDAEANGAVYPRAAYVERVGSGMTADALIAMPANALNGTQYVLYDSSFHTYNNGGSALGGLLTTFDVTSANLPTAQGPVASNVLVAPAITVGNVDLNLSATLASAVTDVVAGEYFIDVVGAPGTGAAFTIGASGLSVPVNSTILSTTVQTLAYGSHQVYVRGQDASGAWGVVSAASFNYIKSGPQVTNLNLNTGGYVYDSGNVMGTDPTNGTRDVVVYATGDLRYVDPTGTLTVADARYYIDGAGPYPMTLASTGQNLVGLSATILSSTIDALTPAGTNGVFTITVEAQDNLGNWGSPATTPLYVDKTGPDANALSLAPGGPNNGTRANDINFGAVLLRGTFDDPQAGNVRSNISFAEFFVDAAPHAPANYGSGAPVIPTDGVFNAPTELGYRNIPLADVKAMPEGPNTLWVHAKDKAGNWGTLQPVTITVDKTGPAITAGPTITYTTMPANTAARRRRLTLTATATDPVVPSTASGSNIVAGEWFRGFDPGAGLATPMNLVSPLGASRVMTAAINTTGWQSGVYTLTVRGKDEAGNWGTTSFITISVSGGQQVILASTFNTGALAEWGRQTGNVGLAVNVPGIGAALAVTHSPLAPLAYLTDWTVYRETTYAASFKYFPNGVNLAGKTQDIFVGRDMAGNEVIFGVQVDETQNPAAPYEVRAYVVDSNGNTTVTNWVDITNAPHTLSVRWEAGSAAPFVLSVDGAAQTLTGLDTQSRMLDEVRLGAVNGSDATVTGTEYFGNFESFRWPFLYYFPLIVN